ncbi:rRNA biogenesis protein rrp36 [Kickxella alabastrina]|uniref:rRNA biogenesis protein rrp36 n=1 Tax=Kickxella alabastrina TaxID=61397 RepID=A0ACC1I9D5_9FUNG|nr:rRNA biogenesis protein rrp36 [Kickxella alabastrina]
MVKSLEQYSSNDDSSSNSDNGESDNELSQNLSGSESEIEEEENTETKADRIRKQLAEVPFSQLIRIQQQMGSKKFNQTIAGVNGGGKEKASKTKKQVQRALKMQHLGQQMESESESDSGSESSDSGPETVSKKPLGRNANGSGGKVDLHRNSKKMPTQMSSKRPVSRFRQVVESTKPTTRDPRFDSLSGNFNEDLFEKSYDFLDKQQEEEIEQMRKQAQQIKDKDPEEAERIKLAVGSMQSRIAAKSQKKHTQELMRKHRKKEEEAVKEGKMPYFLKKKDLKQIQVAERFSRLKDSSALDTFLEKRRKRNATKDHRNMPYQRREQ